MNDEAQSSIATNINNKTPNMNNAFYLSDEAQSNTNDDQTFTNIFGSDDEVSNDPLLDSHLQCRFHP